MDLFLTIFDSYLKVFLDPNLAQAFLVNFKNSRYRRFIKICGKKFKPEFEVFFCRWSGFKKKENVHCFTEKIKNKKISFKKPLNLTGEFFCHGFFCKSFLNRDVVFVSFKKKEIFFLIDPESLRAEKSLEKYFEFLIYLLFFLNIKSGRANLFHGAVLKTGANKCILVAGSSGQGKSTLAKNWPHRVLADEWALVKQNNKDYWVYFMPFFWQNRRLGQLSQIKKARLNHLFILDRLNYLPDRKLSLAEETGFFLKNGLYKENMFCYLLNRSDLLRRIDFIVRICYTKKVKVIKDNCLTEDMINQISGKEK